MGCRSRARRDGWTAEFRIPFSQLRFNNTDGGPVGFAVIREVGRLAETSTWPLLSRNANGFVSQFAEVRGLTMGGSPKKLELLPYTVGSFVAEPGAATIRSIERTDPAGSLGLDLKYALRPGLTLTATVNPDFGQVEADPAVVNLDAFETFFQERRPFFVEGSGTFQFNVDCNDGQCTGLFYSRRIGRAPQGSAVARGRRIRRVAGSRDDHRRGQADGPRRQVLDRRAERGHRGRRGARSRAPGWRGATQAIEPLSGYSVVRARREFANQSNVGFMMTSTNRQLADGVSFLPEDALYRRHRLRHPVEPALQLLRLLGRVRTSTGSTEAITRLQRNNVHAFQRPDADHVEAGRRRDDADRPRRLAQLRQDRRREDALQRQLRLQEPGFDINDLGFQRRADERYVSHWFQMRDMVPGRFTRSFIWNLNQYAGWNFDGDRLWSGGNVNMHWTWKNYYTTSFGFNVNGAPFRDRITRGGPGVLGNPQPLDAGTASGPTAARLFASYNGYYENDRQGTMRLNVGPSVTWRPTTATSVSTGLPLQHQQRRCAVGDQRGRAPATRATCSRRLKQRTSAFTMRVNYTLTPKLSIQTYAEPFVSAGQYSNYKTLVDGRAPEYNDRYRPYAYERQRRLQHPLVPHDQRAALGIQAGVVAVRRLAAEPIGLSRTSATSTSRATSAASSRAPAHNVFLVKLSYWLNM